MPHAYTEAQIVQQPAIGLFAELGWPTVSALVEETFGATATLLREMKGIVGIFQHRERLGQLATVRQASIFTICGIFTPK